MSEKQPDALRLATVLGNDFDTYTDTWSAKEAAAELRRLHEVNSDMWRLRSVNDDLMDALRKIAKHSTDEAAAYCANAAINKAKG